MKLLFFYLIGIFYLTPLSAQIQEVSSGTIERLANVRSDLIKPRNIDVWLPENYNPERSYSVLYMHDGQMLFDSTTTWNGQEWGVDEKISQLIENNKIEDCIVVGIWNVREDRHNNYFPQKPFESLPSELQDSLLNINRETNPLFGGPVDSDNYLRFIVNVVKPIVDEKYATKKDKEHTFIIGSSMGGLISMYAFFEYPEVFGGAACLSTHWIGGFTQNDIIPKAFQAYLSSRKALIQDRKLYFDHGTATLDSFYPPHQKEVDKIFMNTTDEPIQYLSKAFKGAAHTERDWNTRLDIPLLFLLSE